MKFWRGGRRGVRFFEVGEEEEDGREVGGGEGGVLEVEEEGMEMGGYGWIV